MTTLTTFNQALRWLTAATDLPAHLDGLVLCGNSLPSTAVLASHIAQDYQLPSIVIAGGVGHATKYLRQNLGVHNQLSEAELFATVVRQAGYTGNCLLDTTSTNTGSNAQNARALAPQSWRHVLLVQDPVLARRATLTFQQVWGPAVHFDRFAPVTLALTQLEPLRLKNNTQPPANWPTAYFTELVLGEFQRLHDTPTGYGPNGAGFIPHVSIPATALSAAQQLAGTTLQRKR